MKKAHYHLAATQLTFVDTESGMAREMGFNVVATTEDRLITIAVIDNIQKQAQMLFRKQVEDPKIVVTDVLIQGISYLGHMTQEQFTYKPPIDEQKAAQAEQLMKDKLFGKGAGSA